MAERFDESLGRRARWHRTEGGDKEEAEAEAFAWKLSARRILSHVISSL